MLLDQVYRHRRLGMILIFVFIGLPMVFFIPGVDFFRANSATGLDIPVAKVGSSEISAGDFYQRFLQAQEERQRFGQPAGAQDMVNDGTVDSILDSLINQALVKEQTRGALVRPDNKFLQQRLKDDPYFQNAQGEFDPGLYNQWVQGATDAKFDWDALYDGYADEVNREAYMELIGASARVTDAEVRKTFNDRNTKLKIRAIPIQPAVDLTDDQIRAFYDTHLEEFMTPSERVAEYVAISLLPPVPPLADELIARAGAGEDFAELAKAHSESLDADSGGDLGWISETPGLRENEKVLFEMQPGEVRGPVRSILGLHIYKVEETRTNEAGDREVHARQILLRPALDEAKRTARVEQANALRLAAATGDTGLQVAATDAGLEVRRTGRISERTESIEGISEADLFEFRMAVSDLSVGQLSEVIEARESLFVAEVVELYPPEQRAFEEALEDVKRAAIGDVKQTEEYQQRVAQYVTRIAQEAKSIDEVKTLFPELSFEVKETDPFGMDDMLFNQGLFIDTRQIFGRLVFETPGRLVGPFADMLRVPHFIEVVDRTLPEGETWDAQFETEKADLRRSLIANRELERRADFVQHLVAEANDTAQIQKDYDVIFEILGLNQQTESPASTEVAPPPPLAPPGEALDTDPAPVEAPVDLPTDTPPSSESETVPVETSQPATPE